jgi:hypothetical protein
MDVNSKQQTITQQDNMVLEPVVLYITVNTMLFVARSMMVLMSGHSIHISMCLTASGCLWLILIHTKIMKNMLNVLGQRGEKRRAEGYLIETTIKLHKSNNYIDG